MWGTIANFKENLNKIALDVHDDDDEEILSFYAGSPAADAAVSDRRNSHGSAHSKSAAVRSRPLANGTDHAHPSLSEVSLPLPLSLKHLTVELVAAITRNANVCESLISLGKNESGS